ncbi:MAG: outer membrane beta-barrel protein [Candidatus Omnitrophota bacterium]
MRFFKLTGLFIVLFCVFLAVPSYSAVSREAKKTEAKQKREAKKKIASLYKKALSYYFKGDLDESKKTFDEILALDPGQKKAKRYIEKKIPTRRKVLADRKTEKAEREAKIKSKKKAKPKSQKKLAKLRKEGLTSHTREPEKTGKEEGAEETEPLDISKDVEKVATIVTGGSPKEALDEKVRYLRTDSGWEYDATRQKGIRFKLNTNANYDSNIYLTNTNRKVDVVTHIIPGIYGYYGTPGYLLYGFYDTDIQIYGLHPKDTRLNQRVGAKILLFRDRPFKLMFSDTFMPTSAPATSEIQPFVKRMNNNFNATARYDISPKTSVAFTYNQLLQNYVYRTYEKYSYFRNSISPVLYWHLSPKTSLTLDYELALTNYYKAAKTTAAASSNYDSQFHQIRAGIEGDLTPKSKIFFRTGYQHRHYNDSRLKTADAWVLEGVYDWAITPKVGLNFVASHDITESTFEDVGYYKSFNLYASCKWRTFKNLDLTGRGFYVRSNYPHQKLAETERLERVDNLYGAGAELTYNFANWIAIFASYDYKIRTSNFVDYRYKDNQFRWGAKVNF